MGRKDGLVRRCARKEASAARPALVGRCASAISRTGSWVRRVAPVRLCTGILVVLVGRFVRLGVVSIATLTLRTSPKS
jgi:hypothetical protein